MNVVSAQGLTPAANLDEAMLRMWLHGKQPNTALAYEADARRFLAFSGKSIAETTLAEVASSRSASAAPTSRAPGSASVVRRRDLFTVAMMPPASPRCPRAQLTSQALPNA